jgi:hypothetical protein
VEVIINKNRPGPKSRSAITVRPSRDLLDRLDRWIATQDGAVSRAEAVRRVAETGLNRAGVPSKAQKSNRGAEQAAGIAGDMIDCLLTTRQRAMTANGERRDF